jgi:FtsP/CotA-like multicopper oxidase with cupredoxin domain
MKKSRLAIVSVTAVTVLVVTWAVLYRSTQMATASNDVKLANGQVFKLDAKKVSKDINGKTQSMLAYNGSIPGPTLEVQEGSSATVNFTNKLDADTALHFHGVRDDNSSDGVVGVTQKAIKPGASYSYKLSFPDPGVYWYHPHLREDSSQPLGLYGSIIVTPKAVSYWSPINNSVPLMVGDILMDKGKIVPFSKTESDYTLMGRFGNTMLVNGSTSYHLFAKTGEVVRYYVTNVASTRPFNVTIPGAKIKLVGGDNGKYETETFVDSVTLGPSERAIIDVLYDMPGTYALQNTTPETSYKLATVTVTSDKPKTSYASQFKTLRTNTDTVTSINPFRAAFTKPDDKSLTLTMNTNKSSMSNMNMGGGSMSSMNMPGMNAGIDTDKIEWEDTMPDMNKASTSNSLTWLLKDQTTGLSNNQINWQFTRGQQVKIKIYNDPNSDHPMQHPIHIHGQRFLVTSINGKTNDNLVWKDTVLVGKGDTVEVLVDMSNPGTWLIHCHIPEHMESGMQIKYKVG